MDNQATIPDTMFIRISMAEKLQEVFKAIERNEKETAISDRIKGVTNDPS